MNAKRRDDGERPKVPLIPRLATVPGLEALSCDRHLAKHMRDVTPSEGDHSDTLVVVTRRDVLDLSELCNCGRIADWYLRTVAVVR